MHGTGEKGKGKSARAAQKPGGGNWRDWRQRAVRDDGLTDTREIRVKTPFGDPSDAIVSARWKGSAWPFWRATDAGIVCCPAS